MKTDLPGWIKRNIHIKMVSEHYNDVTLVFSCGPFFVNFTFSLEEFQQMLGDLLGTMVDEWAILDYLVTLLAEKQSGPKWKTQDELPPVTIGASGSYHNFPSEDTP